MQRVRWVINILSMSESCGTTLGIGCKISSHQRQNSLTVRIRLCHARETVPIITTHMYRVLRVCSPAVRNNRFEFGMFSSDDLSNNQ